MSSILKALKKAEQESPEHQHKIGPSLNLNVRTALRSGRQAPYGFFSSPKRWIFLMGAGAVLLSASYLLFFADTRIDPVPLTIPSQPASPAPVKAIAQKAPDPPAIKDSKPILPDAGPNDAVRKEESPPPAAEKPPAAQKPDAKKEILPLKDETLSIQAISWAKNPSDRIAVINNKIVGEGESVQGYDILEIGKDEVIFRRSDQKFRLAFNYR